MSGKARTLLLIASFVLITVGSFVWFILNWDPAQTDPVVNSIPLMQGNARS